MSEEPEKTLEEYQKDIDALEKKLQSQTTQGTEAASTLGRLIEMQNEYEALQQKINADLYKKYSILENYIKPKIGFFSWLKDIDARALAMILTLVGFLILLLLAPMWLGETVIANALQSLSPIVTLIMGYYFGVKSAPKDAISVQDLVSMILNKNESVLKEQAGVG